MIDLRLRILYILVILQCRRIVIGVKYISDQQIKKVYCVAIFYESENMLWVCDTSAGHVESSK